MTFFVILAAGAFRGAHIRYSSIIPDLTLSPARDDMRIDKGNLRINMSDYTGIMRWFISCWGGLGMFVMHDPDGCLSHSSLLPATLILLETDSEERIRTRPIHPLYAHCLSANLKSRYMEFTKAVPDAPASERLSVLVSLLDATFIKRNIIKAFELAHWTDVSGKFYAPGAQITNPPRGVKGRLWIVNGKNQSKKRMKNQMRKKQTKKNPTKKKRRKNQTKMKN